MTSRTGKPTGSRENLADAADSARRALLADQNTRAANQQAKELTGIARFEEIRQRIAENYYTQPEILARIADNLTEEIQ